jgi:hypothetical protein
VVKKKKYNWTLPAELAAELDALWSHFVPPEKKVFHQGKVGNHEKWIICSMAILAMLDLSDTEMDHYIAAITAERVSFARLIADAKNHKLRERMQESFPAPSPTEDQADPLVGALAEPGNNRLREPQPARAQVVVKSGGKLEAKQVREETPKHPSPRK